MRFLHIADVHLGNQQYNLTKRFNDFGRAFLRAVDLAMTQEVDAVIIAGDLFHKATIEPKTLLQAEEGLRRLHEAGIEVVAVHGNHDKARYLAQTSWLEYLADRGLFHLLSPDFSADQLALLPGASYVDVAGTRFIGVPWLGASAPQILAEVATGWERLDWQGIRFCVLVTHAGVEGQMPHMPAGLSFAELEPLHGKVNYLALGHLHKPYEVDDWIYNPGSLETCSFDEEKYQRGAYLVTVQEDGSHTAQHVSTVMRPFISLEFATDSYLTPEAMFEALRQAVPQWQKTIEQRIKSHPEPATRQPVVRLVLRGNVSFERTLLDLQTIRSLIVEAVDALLVRVENRTSPLGVEAVPEQGLNRAELEQIVLETLAKSDSRFSQQSAAWSNLMLQVKSLALYDNDPEAIYRLLDEQMTQLEDEPDVDL